MKQEIAYEDYSKVEIKVGTVLSVKKNELVFLNFEKQNKAPKLDCML